MASERHCWELHLENTDTVFITDPVASGSDRHACYSVEVLQCTSQGFPARARKRTEVVTRAKLVFSDNLRRLFLYNRKFGWISYYIKSPPGRTPHEEFMFFFHQRNSCYHFQTPASENIIVFCAFAGSVATLSAWKSALFKKISLFERSEFEIFLNGFSRFSDT